MSPKHKRYALYAAVVVVALLIGFGARYAVDGPLHNAVATAPLGDGTSGSGPADSENAASAAKSPSERAEDAVAAAAGNAAKNAAPANSEGGGTAVTTAPASPPSGPSFDIVRVEPTGEAIVAGRAAPGAEVELLAGGRVISSAKANEAGEFVIMPERLSAGGHELTLRLAGGQAVSAKAVVVSVPSSPQGEVLVVAGEPGKPSEVLQAGAPTPAAVQAATAPAPTPSAEPLATSADMPLRIGTVEAEAGRLFVQGTGPAGARATIYLNDTAVSDAVVGTDGRWSLTVERGLAPGSYGVRVDQVGSDGKVVARAAVPFEFSPESPVRTAVAEPDADGGKKPGQPSPDANPIDPAPERDPASTVPPQAGAPGPAASPALPPKNANPASPPADAPAVASESQTAATDPAGSDSAHPVLAEIGTVSVRRGDSLWRISRATYGQGTRYTVIYEANVDQIRDPDLIYPGQVFVMPPRG